MIAEFFELPADADFLERGAALVRGEPPKRYPKLAAAEREALDAACRPGQELLCRA